MNSEIFWWTIGSSLWSGSGGFAFEFLFSKEAVVHFLSRSAAPRQEDTVSAKAHFLGAGRFPKTVFRLTEWTYQDGFD